LEAANLARVVIISSASVHTSLPSSGARTKRDAEAAIRASDLCYTIVRPTMIYGNARDRNLARLLDYLERVSVFPLFGDGSGLMQPVFIDDLVEVILRALVSPLARKETYDVGGAAPLSYRELVEAAAAALSRPVRFARVPLGLAAGSLRLANRVGLRFLREEQVHRLTEDKVVDNERVRSDLGWTPCAFAEGIAAEVRARRRSSGSGGDLRPGGGG
jgi:nucleoside-diphosphate-sugar epimerase